MDGSLPPCGLYLTTQDVAGVPPGRLVYFHNHGDPGPGIYLPEGWTANRARFGAQGHTLRDPNDAQGLRPLPSQGLYRVMEQFACCDKKCHTYPAEGLVQLGYNGSGDALLFQPRWTQAGFSIPEKGFKIEPDRLSNLAPLKVPTQRPEGAQAEEELH